MWVTDDPKGRWFLGDIGEPSPADRRQQVRQAITDIAKDLGLDEHVMMTRNFPTCVDGKLRVSVIAHELLSPWMSNVDIAMFLNCSTTTFCERLRIWRERNPEGESNTHET